jgi:two-component system sensor histidine kinase ArlS
MPVRLRLTFLFTLLVMIILLLVCCGIYYFSYTARVNAIKTRLTNRAVNTARLLAQKETFDIKLVQKLDSLTTIALKGKTVQAYDSLNNKIYSYSSIPGDTLSIDADRLTDARTKGSSFFRLHNKEVIAYHYTDNNANIVVVSAAEDVDGKQNLNILFKILLFSFLGGNVIVLVIGYFFSAGLLKPVKKITADVEYISAQNLTRRIKTGKSKDEWYQLASTLNQLLDRLQDSFELQGRFISNASHELSTPLTSISSQLEIALQKDRDAKEYKQLMQSIYQDVRHMSKLTQTLLEFAKASGTTNGLEINLVRIDEIILSLPSQVARLNPAYSVSLQFDKLPDEEENLLVFGNEPLLEMAIKNIVVNACKYSGDHHAAILLKIVDKKITIIISDEGNGIPENELDNIFQPFYQVEKNSSNEGFGLGLALARRVIVLHKGTIKATSRVNAGTSFSITLPAAASPGA